jgi:hypothetical protein
MKRANHIFVSVNPNSPKKRRRNKLITYGKAVSFGSIGMASESDSPNCAHTPDENQPHPTLGSPWTPLPMLSTTPAPSQFSTNIPQVPYVSSPGPAYLVCHTATATCHASGVCRPDSMATAPLAVHLNQIHSCTLAWNSSFAVEDSDEIPHGDDGVTTGHCHVRRQFKVRHERTGKVRKLRGCICIICLDRSFLGRCRCMFLGRRRFG